MVTLDTVDTHNRRSLTMTWEDAERLFPGCSAEWDVIAISLADYTVEQFFENAAGGLSLYIRHSISSSFYVYGMYKIQCYWKRT